MSSSIECCFRGCRQAIWSESVSGFEVVCSSATCLSCRKMVLCIEHFEEVFSAQKGIACANCGESRYWVCLFEPARLSPALAQCVRENGGDIEFRYAASAVHESAPPQGPEERQIGSHGQWQLEPILPPLADGIRLAPGVSAIESVRGTHLHLDGSGEPRLVPGKIKNLSMSGTSECFAVEFEPFGGRTALIQWFTQDGAAGVLIAPDGVSLHLGEFIDEHRIGIVAEDDAGRVELREVTLEPPNRARSRRILPLENGSKTLWAPIPSQNREAVVLTQENSQGARTDVVRLADSHRTTIANHSPSEGLPKALAAASKASTVAWVDAQGRVRAVSSPGQTPRLLGETPYEALGVAPSGGEVAWLEQDEIVVADLRSGRITRTPQNGIDGQLRFTA